VRGSRADCILLINKINTFLSSELQLNLNLHKKKVTNARSDMAYLLGINIRITPLDKRQIQTIQTGRPNVPLKNWNNSAVVSSYRKISQ
jgi:hypothetical protein